MKHNLFVLGTLLLTLCFISPSQAQVGIFDDSVDIGEPLQFGEVSFEDDTYIMLGGGTTIGRNSFEDQFFFVYKELSGSFRIQADPFPISLEGEGGVMIRQDLDVDSAHASWLRMSDSVPGSNTNATYGTLFPHIRSLKGGASIVDGDLENGFENTDNVGPAVLERIGNSIHFYSTNDAGELVYQRTEVIPMTETVYAGLALVANSEEGLAEFEMEAVELEEYPLWVGRSIPIDDWNSGETIEVTVTAKASESVDALVNEVVPALCTTGEISASDGEFEVDNEEGSIDWTLNGFNGEATLTYSLTLGDRQSGSWQGTFSDGIHRESYIGGDSILPTTPEWGMMEEPVSISPDEITLMQVENGTPSEEEGVFHGLAIDPRVHSGVTVVNMGGGESNWVEIPITIEEAGTYYFFGNVRGEDGNSDSWHFGIDDPPAGDDSSRWNINNADAFSIEWVESEDPDLDPRPFELSAGEHTILIANREDSASIDWLAATTDSSLGIGAFNEITGEIFDPLSVLEGLSELGIFEGHQDIVEAANPDNLGAEGDAAYDPVNQEYIVVGSGNDIWNTADNFHFMYREVSGDFTLESTIEADSGTSTNEWVKAMLMARQELTGESVNFGILQRPDGLINTQWRLAAAEGAASTDSSLRPTLPIGTTYLMIEREGDMFRGYYKAATEDEYTMLDELEVIMDDPILVGLGVTAHEVGSLSIGYYSNVSLIVNGEPVAVEDWSLY